MVVRRLLVMPTNILLLISLARPSLNCVTHTFCMGCEGARPDTITTVTGKNCCTMISLCIVAGICGSL
ncbi:hypothetical protein PR003_g16659 [Phytophthora rubi]|uniref:Secreted protein n=1 Tax=Phytophthora rubi TaxID=129364 RepID=A0A6A3JRW7_9STRA|nr:hypothetical protein PR002_g19259 [Phytophthora rubi]KAE8998106.1 hypothetical protein PR001_g19416 [Phytophthora rubi]KAE9324760.1 hypothetical protein PR003_g16659 [Phytophthora rubi]